MYIINSVNLEQIRCVCEIELRVSDSTWENFSFLAKTFSQSYQGRYKKKVPSAVCTMCNQIAEFRFFKVIHYRLKYFYF